MLVGMGHKLERAHLYSYRIPGGEMMQEDEFCSDPVTVTVAHAPYVPGL